MKKALFLVFFIFLALAFTVNAEIPKKIYKIQKAYVYLSESLLISDSDLNCSYFIRDGMPLDIKVVAVYESDTQRLEFTDNDNLIIDKGSKDGLKKGNLLLIMSEGKPIQNLGRYYLKKSLAEITAIYDHRAVIELKNGCNPVNIGDFAILFKPEKTLFTKKMDYLLARVPANPVSGTVLYNDLSLATPAAVTATSQYVTVDLGAGVVGKGTFLLIYRILKRDLPPLIIGLGIVIHAENTNSTVKILDANADISVNDQVWILPASKETDTDVAGDDNQENIPIVETLQAETRDKENAPPEELPTPEEKENSLIVDIPFDFDSKQPRGDHSADFAAIRDFIGAKSEYLVTLRGYTCSIGGEEYNLRLAKERVEGIKNILVTQYGVDAAHVETFFYGEKEARFDNSSEVERLKNRLVKIEVSGQ